MGSIFTISGHCVPNLQYHKHDHNTGHTNSSKSTKPNVKPPAKETSTKEKTTSIPTVKEDLKNPIRIEDGTAEQFP
jgi:hypothetical protein